MSAEFSDFFKTIPAPAAESLAKAGMTHPLHLLCHLPLRYENWRQSTPIADIQHGDTATVEGVITDARVFRGRNGRQQMLVALQDAAGDDIALRFFHLTPGLQKSMFIGRRLLARGTARLGRGLELSHPKIQSSAGADGLRAIYPALGKITPQQLRRLIALAFENSDFSCAVPARLRAFDGGELGIKAAFETLHYPGDENAAMDAALRRLRFDELLAHQITLRVRYHRRAKLQAPMLNPPDDWQTELTRALPFTLTAAQRRAIDEVCRDLMQPQPMRRLLQGDVGSGKTAVAAFACLAAAKCGHIAVLVAPTEILANQHLATLSGFFASSHIHCELITAAVKGAARRECLSRLRFGLSHIVIGTHALFHDDIALDRLALVIIDEQHRFGVEQRAALAKKSGDRAHLLMMSATPIPRTLALAAFADMDISILDEKPAGRTPVRTFLTGADNRDKVLQILRDRLQEDGRAFWVCPLVEESDSLHLQDVHSLLEKSRQKHPELRAQILHGRMSAAEKSAVISDFHLGRVRLLIATTVVEVGVDVPQADVMVIDHAERMGLAQLHQLRGRVGRGDKEGSCMLLYARDLSESALARLKILRESDDGFAIARRDLALRGPGEWIGVRQSGLPSFRLARLGEDDDILNAARTAAEWLLKNDRDGCVRHVRRWFPKAEKKAEE